MSLTETEKKLALIISGIMIGGMAFCFNPTSDVSTKSRLLVFLLFASAFGFYSWMGWRKEKTFKLAVVKKKKDNDVRIINDGPWNNEKPRE